MKVSDAASIAIRYAPRAVLNVFFDPAEMLARVKALVSLVNFRCPSSYCTPKLSSVTMLPKSARTP